MDKCQCSLSIRLTGDGCRYCQPQLYIDRLEEWLDEARKERDELQDGLEKCRDAFDSTSITDVEIEGLWAQAIGNPSDVAQYVEAMVKAQQWQPIDTEGKTCEQLRYIRDQMAEKIKQINAHLENVANDLMHSRVGSVCTSCNRGKFRIDGNGYHTFLRCNACAHVPALNDDGVDLFATKPPEAE